MEWVFVFLLLVFMVGLRHRVGADWSTYIRHIDLAGTQNFVQAISRGDPAYKTLNWLGAQTGLGIYFVNFVCACIFSWGLIFFCRHQPRPWLAMVVAIPYLVIVVAMGYTRQGTAIGIALMALVSLSERNVIRFIILIAVAATFHKSAVILMPLAVLAGTKNRLWTAVWVSVSFVLFYILLLQDSIDSLQYIYLEREYQSQGAGLRLAMNSVPAILFLLFRRRFARNMNPSDLMFWTWMSLGALGFWGMLAVSPSSTAVDRMALYWIPLQLVVLSRLPLALGRPNGKNVGLSLAVIGYSALVLLTWLIFAKTSYAWLPYQFYPWILLWK